MFTTKVQVAHHDMQDFISNYQDIDKFLTYCQQCNNYNHKWSCPPLRFNPKTYLSQYKSIYLVAVQINYSEDTINSLTTKVRKFFRAFFLRINSQYWCLFIINEFIKTHWQTLFWMIWLQCVKHPTLSIEHIEDVFIGN